MKYIILQASARSEGNTHRIVQALCEHINCDVIDLKTKKIAPYSRHYSKVFCKQLKGLLILLFVKK